MDRPCAGRGLPLRHQRWREDLDESLRRFETVYPAAGDDHSAVKLTIPELEEVAGAVGWVDVCKELQ